MVSPLLRSEWCAWIRGRVHITVCLDVVIAFAPVPPVLAMALERLESIVE
jgi:hypothetical protein